MATSQAAETMGWSPSSPPPPVEGRKRDFDQFSADMAASERPAGHLQHQDSPSPSKRRRLANAVKEASAFTSGAVAGAPRLVARSLAQLTSELVRFGPRSSWNFVRGLPFAARTVVSGFPRVFWRARERQTSPLAVSSFPTPPQLRPQATTTPEQHEREQAGNAGEEPANEAQAGAVAGEEQEQEEEPGLTAQAGDKVEELGSATVAALSPVRSSQNRKISYEWPSPVKEEMTEDERRRYAEWKPPAAGKTKPKSMGDRKKAMKVTKTTRTKSKTTAKAAARQLMKDSAAEKQREKDTAEKRHLLKLLNEGKSIPKTRWSEALATPKHFRDGKPIPKFVPTVTQIYNAESPIKRDAAPLPSKTNPTVRTPQAAAQVLDLKHDSATKRQLFNTAIDQARHQDASTTTNATTTPPSSSEPVTVAGPATPDIPTTTFPGSAWPTPISPDDTSMIDAPPPKPIQNVHFGEDKMGFSQYDRTVNAMRKPRAKPFPTKERYFFEDEPTTMFDWGTHTPRFRKHRPQHEISADTPDGGDATPRGLANHPAENSPTQPQNPTTADEQPPTSAVDDTSNSTAAPEEDADDEDASEVSLLVADLLSFNHSTEKRDRDATLAADKAAGIAKAAKLREQFAKRKADDERKLREKEAQAQRERDAENEAARQAELEAKRARSIVPPLSADWNARVDKAMASPMTADFGRLTRRDLGTLLPQTPTEGIGWLNDEIINTYGGYIAAKVRKLAGQEGRLVGPPKCHLFTSQMYTSYKSKKGDIAQFARWNKRAKLEGKALLAAEQVFIPINDHSHWTLLEIKPQARTIHYYDSLGRGSDNAYTRFGLEWVKMTLGKEFDASEWKVVESFSSQQKNGVDCGVFVCMNVLALAQGKEPREVVDDGIIGEARRVVAACLLNGDVTEELGF